MLLVIKVMALQLAWLACVPVYLASKQQAILKQPLSKSLAWSVFTMAVVVSVCLLSQLYLLITASLIVLLVVMTTWILLAFMMPHYRRLSTVIPALAMLLLIIALTGGGDVA